MQKLNLKLVALMKELNCNETEINIINLITKYQDDRGKLENFSCKFALENISITKQHFYNNFWKLKDKGILIVENTKGNGFDVQIPLNDYFIYPGIDEKLFYKENPYLNTNINSILYTDFFKKASKNLMYLILDLLKLLNQNTTIRTRKLSAESLKRYAKINSNRTLKKYLEHLKSYFFIKENPKTQVYTIGIKQTKSDKFSEARNRIYYRLKTFLDKYKIRYNNWKISNTIDLFVNNGYEDKFGGLLHKALIDTCFKHGELKPALVNRTISIISKEKDLYFKDGLKGKQDNIQEQNQEHKPNSNVNFDITDNSCIETTLTNVLGTGHLMDFINRNTGKLKEYFSV